MDVGYVKGASQESGHSGLECVRVTEAKLPQRGEQDTVLENREVLALIDRQGDDLALVLRRERAGLGVAPSELLDRADGDIAELGICTGGSGDEVHA